MAMEVDGGGQDELITQFLTREGTYRLMILSQYSRPNRVGNTNTQGNASVRVSFVNMPDPSGNGDKICFNFGNEVYVYVYKGPRKPADLGKPVDKKVYKSTNPTCHDFNKVTVTGETVSLLIGFSTGQIQLVDPIKKDLCKLFNEERLIDKTKVTCIRWVPGSSNLFLASHSSGQLYLYNEELPCSNTAPHYQPYKQGDGYAIHTCKTKATRNPLYRWVLGAEGCCINELAFSPCGTHLAVVSQDGFLRVFQYNLMDLLGVARSYFGGFLCVCWSPDGRYVVVGGEDDLVTVWSFHERRIVARGQGHRSWVSVVAFDPFTSTCGSGSGAGSGAGSGSEGDADGADDDEDAHRPRPRPRPRPERCYRLGSVGQDTHLCLWDITEDVLRQPMCARTRTTSAGGGGGGGAAAGAGSLSGSGTINGNGTPGAKCNSNSLDHSTSNSHSHSHSHHSAPATTTTLTLTQRLAGLGFGDRKDAGHKRHLSLVATARGTHTSTSADKSTTALKSTQTVDDPMRLIGTNLCPRFDECPILEPLICKKIAQERLTALVFREDGFVTACQDGYINSWVRPSKVSGVSSHVPSSPTNTSSGPGGGGGGGGGPGTVV